MPLVISVEQLQIVMEPEPLWTVLADVASLRREGVSEKLF